MCLLKNNIYQINMKLIKLAEVNTIAIKKNKKSLFSKVVSAIIAANVVVLTMIYFTVYSN